MGLQCVVGDSSVNKLSRISPMRILLDRRPDTVPLAVWRLMTWVKVWAFLYVIAWVGYGVFSLLVTSSKLALVVLILVWGLVMLLMDLTARWINKRVRKNVLANEFRICINCGYRLRNLPARHRCPECGTQYDAIELERKWRDWFSRDYASTNT